MHAALAYLNSRTPHRFTGVYRYDGSILHNEFLFVSPARQGKQAASHLETVS